MIRSILIFVFSVSTLFSGVYDSEIEELKSHLIILKKKEKNLLEEKKKAQNRQVVIIGQEKRLRNIVKAQRNLVDMYNKSRSTCEDKRDSNLTLSESARNQTHSHCRGITHGKDSVYSEFKMMMIQTNRIVKIISEDMVVAKGVIANIRTIEEALAFVRESIKLIEEEIEILKETN
jgi:hypothetical protein